MDHHLAAKGHQGAPIVRRHHQMVPTPTGVLHHQPTGKVVGVRHRLHLEPNPVGVHLLRRKKPVRRRPVSGEVHHSHLMR